MIKSLHIKNYALIDALDIQFHKGLTIITGETGAGKSILLGALSLIMGERADTKSLFDDSKKCIIEGRFDIRDYDLEGFFESNDLDYEEELIIRREITPKGKSRAFVNDTPTGIKVLQRMSAVLIDLHQQFDTLDIHETGFQLRLLDALAHNTKGLKEYQKAYKKYQKQKQRLDILQTQNANTNRELEFMRFQLTELQEADLVPHEQETIEEEFSSLSHAEETKQSTAEAFKILCENEQAIVNQLQDLNQLLLPASKVDATVEKLQERLSSIIEELNDVGNELERHAEEMEYDPERIQELQERLDLLYRLQKKHSVNNNTELLELQAQLEKSLKGYDNIDEEIEQLTLAVDAAEKDLMNSALVLSKRRKKIAPSFAKNVAATLSDLSMQSAQLVVDFKKSSTPGPSGTDEVEFLFTANKGSTPKPIKQVASGGELSRLTLVTKSLVASAMALPTLIFDEIDAGVSGDVALRMGHILRGLSGHHQVIVITHSPQVAARANEHLFVYKKEQDERTTTKVRLLNKDERIRAIATMLSQNPPSESAIENAKELING